MKEILFDGHVISIDHLAPMTFPCSCPDIGRDLTVSVTFSNHCYTEAFDDTKHTAEDVVVYDAGSRARIFCPIRHGLSAQLPSLIASLPTRRVFQTAERRNYVFSVPILTAGQIYQVFFMVQRAEQTPSVDLKLTVESAYPVVIAPVLPNRPGAIRFKVLAYKVLRREQISFAAR
jgi:hypothetical protein